jgi:hypothetical protein
MKPTAPTSLEPRLAAAIPLAALAAGLALAACGGDDDRGSRTDGGGPGDGPTYHQDVAPILARRCTGCHTAGGIAPFSLESYDDAGPRAQAIRQAVLDRRMPPWNIDESGTCHTFVDSRWLSDEELATLARWAETGAAEGAPAPAPERPAAPGLNSVGATLDIGVDYVPNASRMDDYRCFLVDPGLTADRFLVAYQVKPGEPRVVHHVILYSLDTTAAEEAALALDQGEEGPGYTCFGGSRVVESRFLAGWAPGTPATRYPEGTGLRLQAGRKLVVQVHYNLHEGPLPDRTKIDLELADRATEAAVVPIADFDLAVPPGTERAPTEATLPVLLPITVLGVFPHMHTLGRTLRLERIGGGEPACLLDVPRWDFNWQQFYFYEEPVRLDLLDQLRIECVYDTRERTETVRWGEGTQDEMCLAFLYVTP